METPFKRVSNMWNAISSRFSAVGKSLLWAVNGTGAAVTGPSGRSLHPVALLWELFHFVYGVPVGSVGANSGKNLGPLKGCSFSCIYGKFYTTSIYDSTTNDPIV
jgi:hypothetical protein